MNFKPTVLVVFDGFGINTLPGESPLQVAKKPNLDEIEKNYLMTTLQASGLAVGLMSLMSANSGALLPKRRARM